MSGPFEYLGAWPVSSQNEFNIIMKKSRNVISGGSI